MTIKRFFALCFVALVLCHSISHAQTSNEKRIGFTVKEAPWNLTLPAENITVEEREFKPDGRSAYFALTDEKNKLTVSFYIEPVKDCKDAKSCRDLIWKLGNPTWKNLQNVVKTDAEDASVLEFLLPVFQGVTVNQQNRYIEYVKDGFWVDMHISKLLYKPEDRELFEQINKSVRFEPKDK